MDLLRSQVIPFPHRCLRLAMGRSAFIPNRSPLLSLETKPDFLCGSWDAGCCCTNLKLESYSAPSCWKPRFLSIWRKEEPGMFPDWVKDMPEAIQVVLDEEQPLLRRC